MNTEPYGTTIFCDDIRNEVNGKLTLIGCYSGDMNFTNPGPATLPTFSALVNIRIPKTTIFRSLKLHVIKEEGDQKQDILTADLDPDEEDLRRIISEAEKQDKDGTMISLTLPCRWSPLPISESGFIKVRAYLDGEKEIRLGALKVNFPKADQDIDQGSESSAGT
ncbi:hypothetical protein [Thioclava sp. DLFJ4-1]|uniref:hypothetical protein n=1 Tax=Thioclava sp. DLFJ4-1 TaxID=1915313 RepID=UPI00117CC6F2|nr:hypothetical protein [Thioclava sp. DLFJ4-1]